MAEVIRIGPDSGLHFVLVWDEPKPTGTAAEATRGKLAVWASDYLVWGDSQDGKQNVNGFSWTWIELLEFLSRVWSYLEWEEGDPLGLEIDDPLHLRPAAEMRWREMPAKDAARAEEVFWAFEECHNLSNALQGAWLEALWIVRCGNDFLIRTKDQFMLRPVEEVLSSLSDLGSAIDERLSEISDPRATAAIQSWNARNRRQRRDLVRISTGLPSSLIAKIERGRPLAQVWDLPSQGFVLNEVLAAARMVGSSLSSRDAEKVLSRIRRQGKAQTPELDMLADKIAGVLEGVGFGAPIDEGQFAASWLRNRLGLDGEARVEPHRLLKAWGVVVDYVDVREQWLDAVCCWGPRHGPAVFLNKHGVHVAGARGRRATLAHEIAHLLLDRKKSLPLAEVLGGGSSQAVEVRARAFAAEFLLPRTTAGAALLRPGNPEELVNGLCRKFGASQEIVAWQARNSKVRFPYRIYSYLKTLVSDPSRF